MISVMCRIRKKAKNKQANSYTEITEGWLSEGKVDGERMNRVKKVKHMVTEGN